MMLADSLGCWAQLATEISLHRLLQAYKSVVAELVGQPDHRGRSRTGGGSKVGNRSEAHSLRAGNQDRRDTTLGGCELFAVFTHSVGHVHLDDDGSGPSSPGSSTVVAHGRG